MFYSERSKMRVERLLGRLNGFGRFETNKEKAMSKAPHGTRRDGAPILGFIVRATRPAAIDG